MAQSYGKTTNGFKQEFAQTFIESVDDNNYYLVAAKANPWEELIPIELVSLTNPVIITSTNHGLINGQLVSFKGVTGTDELNQLNSESIITNATDDTFELLGVDGTNFTTFTGVGSIVVNKENDWPTVDASEIAIAKTRKEFLYAKKFTSADIVFTYPYVKWSLGSKYAYYNPSIIEQKNFYVATEERNVYLCLWNGLGGNGRLSSVEPTGTSSEVIETTDGYKWKYLYTMSPVEYEQAEFTGKSSLRPLLINDSSARWIVQQSAIAGQIYAYEVISAGSGYTTDDTITVTGDGKSATANINRVSDTGEIQIVNSDLFGQDYTEAFVTINSSTGTGAVISPVITPVKGVGRNAINDLNAFDILIEVSLDGTENDTIPANMPFRKILIWKNPEDNNGNLLTEETYDFRTSFTTSTIVGTFSTNVEVKSESNLLSAYSVSDGGILISDLITKYLTNIIGTLEVGDVITTDTGYRGTVATISSDETVNRQSGTVVYNENRAPVTRRDNHVETYRILLTF